MAGADRRAARVAVFQGHMSPMLQLAGALHAQGLAVTVLHTTFNAPDPARHPEFSFVALPDAISDVVAATKDGTAKILALNAAVEAPGLAERARDALASLMMKSEEEGEPRLACLIIDCTLTGMQKVAAGLGLPTLVLQTCSAACFRMFRSYDMLYEKGYLPAQESNLLLPVKELPPLQVRDLFDPISILPSKEMGLKLLNLANVTTASSLGTIINTFEALEPQELAAIRDELLAVADKKAGIPTFAIGPLHKLNSSINNGDGTTRTSSSSLRSPDRSCMEWLDTHGSRSVLYVSFGSVVQVTEDEFAEIAWGLADSGRPFLWVVRPGLVLGVEEKRAELQLQLPRGQRQGDRVGAAAGGASPRCRRRLLDSQWMELYPGKHQRGGADAQLVTGRYVEDAWKIGILLEGELERGKVKKTIDCLMGEEEEEDGLLGIILRERAKNLEEKARLCLESGGSSRVDFDKLVHHILSL